jgi:hypothetical protein
MKALPLLLLLGCGGSARVPIELPANAVIDFAVTATENSPAIDCTGRMDLARSMVHFSCLDSRPSPATSDEVDATIEYIHRPTEAWLHFMVIGAEKNHYPTYNGIVLAMAIRPNRDGSGWAGDALYYPRDAAFGYEGFAVTANLGH